MSESQLGDAQLLEAHFKAGALHRHCFQCVSINSCSRNKAKDDSSCDIINCPSNCYAIFHSCKLVLHKEVCPNVTVQCVNKFYGCQSEMLRKDVNSHLEKCPASVIVCMAEWNRWPVFTSQRRRHIPFKQHNPHATQGQLDFDLTMRDQRMLANLQTLPRKTKLSLRNYLTRRYPAVPLPNIKRSYDVLADNDFIDIGLTDPYAGARKLDKAQLQIKQWEDDLNARLKGKEIPKKYWEFPEMEKGQIHKHCAYCFSPKCERKAGLIDSKEAPDEACSVIDCRWKCGCRYHACKSSEHSLICLNYEEVDEYDWMLKGVTNLETRFEEIYKKKRAMKKQPVLKEANDFFQGPGRPAHGLLRDANGIPIPPELPKNLLSTRVWLDVKLETVTRLQTKPTQMYSFVCGQEFRRDEFHWHSKTVHDDILGGLNNWVEHRCPMASYGCGFSHRRLFPAKNQAQTIIYSPAVESFGITTTSRNLMKPKLGKDQGNHQSVKTLTDLPFEILELIIHRLDSFR